MTVAGTVTEKVNKQTRAGAPMAFVKVEDRFGEIEVIVFPKILEKHRALLAQGSAIAVTGSVSKKPKTIYLRLPSLEGAVFEKIKAVLDIFIGETPVMLYGETEKKYIKRVGAGADIQPNMLALLKKLLGEENVVIK